MNKASFRLRNLHFRCLCRRRLQPPRIAIGTAVTQDNVSATIYPSPHASFISSPLSHRVRILPHHDTLLNSSPHCRTSTAIRFCWRKAEHYVCKIEEQDTRPEEGKSPAIHLKSMLLLVSHEVEIPRASPLALKAITPAPKHSTFFLTMSTLPTQLFYHTHTSARSLFHLLTPLAPNC